MFKTSKPTERTSTDRIELYVPTDLAAAYAEKKKDVAASTSSNDRHWGEKLRSRLPEHVAFSLTEVEYGGIRPGSVPRPGSALRNGWVEVTPRNGRFDTVDAPSEREQLEVARYELSERQKPEFEARVNEVLEAILEDHSRTWDAWLHIVTLDAATVKVKREAHKEANELARLAREQCPICAASNPLDIGTVEYRTILTGGSTRYSAGPAMRSCFACWDSASTIYRARLDAQVNERTGLTRRQTVLRYLEEADSGR